MIVAMTGGFVSVVDFGGGMVWGRRGWVVKGGMVKDKKKQLTGVPELLTVQALRGGGPGVRTCTAEGVHGDDAAGGVAKEGDAGVWAGGVVVGNVAEEVSRLLCVNTCASRILTFDDGELTPCVVLPTPSGEPLSYASVTLVDPGIAARMLPARLPIRPYCPTFCCPSPDAAMTCRPPVRCEHGLLGIWRRWRSVLDSMAGRADMAVSTVKEDMMRLLSCMFEGTTGKV